MPWENIADATQQTTFFFMNDNLRFTEILKGLSYRPKRCECVLNTLALIYARNNPFLWETRRSSCGWIRIFVDRSVFSGRIHISVDESVSLWTILYLGGHFCIFVDRSVSKWTNSYLSRRTCVSDDSFSFSFDNKAMFLNKRFYF